MAADYGCRVRERDTGAGGDDRPDGHRHGDPSSDTRGILDPLELQQYVELQRFPAGEALAGIVDWFWSVRWDLPPGRSYRSRVLSHPSVNISVGDGPPEGERLPRGPFPVAARVVGVTTRVQVRLLTGAGWNVAAKTTTGGFGGLLAGRGSAAPVSAHGAPPDAGRTTMASQAVPPAAEPAPASAHGAPPDAERTTMAAQAAPPGAGRSPGAADAAQRNVAPTTTVGAATGGAQVAPFAGVAEAAPPGTPAATTTGSPPTSTAELTDRDVPIDRVLPVDAAALAAAMAAATTAAQRAATLAATLAELVAAADPRRLATAREVAGIARAAEVDRSIRSAADLARPAGLGVRTLQRLFAEYAGASPTWVIRRYRLIDAAERVRAGESVVWADVAAELGYADQAHLTRDFSRALGSPPSAYQQAQRRPR